MYPLTSSYYLIFTLASSIHYTVVDPAGYDDHKLYECSRQVLGIDLVYPAERYVNTSKDRLEIACFYESVLKQAIYNKPHLFILFIYKIYKY